MARLDELEFDNESEEERSVEDRVKAQGGSSATPSAAAAAGKGGGNGDDDGVGSDKDEDEEASVVDPRRPAGGAEGDKPKKRRPRFTEDHIIGANGASLCMRVCMYAARTSCCRLARRRVG